MKERHIKCFNCGGDVIIGADSRIGICSSCMAEIPIPSGDVSAVEAYSNANELLKNREFEEARKAYDSILANFPMEAAAFWGYALSEYGIEYVIDPDTSEQKPTLNRLSETYFSSHLYVKKAVEYAPNLEMKRFYQENSALIDTIQAKSLEIASREEPYDVFISYKRTDVGEKRTADSRMAADIYKELVRRGYKTFFAEQSLQVGVEYEPRIYAALHSARVMIAIASKPEYYNAVWVKNEWGRYCNIISGEGKDGNSRRLLIPVFQNMSRDELPPPLGKMPKSVDMSSLANPKQELFKLIAAHFERSVSEDASRLRRVVGGQTGAVRIEESAENYRTRGKIALENGELDKAKEMFDKSLTLEESPEAYLGLMMCSRGICGRDKLNEYDKNISEDADFKMALSCAADSERERYEKIAENCRENERWTKICNEKKRECKTTAESVIGRAESGDISKESVKSCKNITKRADAVIKAKAFLAAKGKSTVWAWLWLLVGNLFPAVFLVVVELFYLRLFTGAAMSIFWGLSRVMTIAGYYFLFRLLGHTSLFSGSVIRLILRLVAIYFIADFISVFSDEKILWYLGVSVAVNLIFALTRGHEYLKDKRLVKHVEHLMPQSTYDELADKMRSDCEAELEKAISVYRQYYRTDEEWNEAVNDWLDCVKQNELKFLNTAKAQADTAVGL
jgi:tetratricopeptide (TPR) repeat protein